jgi:hypothetical protein
VHVVALHYVVGLRHVVDEDPLEACGCGDDVAVEHDVGFQGKVGAGVNVECGEGVADGVEGRVVVFDEMLCGFFESVTILRCLGTLKRASRLA